MEPLPVTIIAGYLGAGKTTLINQMLTDNDGQRLALLVNDFGEINIDAKLVESQDSDTVNLSNGCVCCSLAEDFSRALSQIEKRSDQFDRIIVEMSGIGEPHKVVEWVRNSAFILDGIVVLADTTTILNWAENRYAGPLICRQISTADLILLTHTDLIDQRTVNDVREWLIEFTPAPVLQTPVSMPLIIGFNRSSDNNLQSIHTRLDDHHSASVQLGEPVSVKLLEEWLARRPKQVIRVKGILRTAGDPGVATILQVCGPREEITASNRYPNIDAGSVVAIATIDLAKSDLDNWLSEIGYCQPVHNH